MRRRGYRRQPFQWTPSACRRCIRLRARGRKPAQTRADLPAPHAAGLSHTRPPRAWPGGRASWRMLVGGSAAGGGQYAAKMRARAAFSSKAPWGPPARSRRRPNNPLTPRVCWRPRGPHPVSAPCRAGRMTWVRPRRRSRAALPSTVYGTLDTTSALEPGSQNLHGATLGSSTGPGMSERIDTTPEWCDCKPARVVGFHCWLWHWVQWRLGGIPSPSSTRTSKPSISMVSTVISLVSRRHRALPPYTMCPVTTFST